MHTLTGKEIIRIESLKVRYVGKKDFALKGVNMEVYDGEFLGIIGHNGAGKTTLALTLNGLIPHLLETIMEGSVYVNGVNTREKTVSELSLTVGIVFQNPYSQISGLSLTVREEVAFGLQNLGLPKEEIISRIDEALEIVGLKGLEERAPYNLSGGQTQRLAIATVLAMRPKVMVLDEVTAQLDPIGTFEVVEAIRRLRDKYKMTIVFISNKSELLARMAERVIVLNQGEIWAQGPTKEVFSKVDELMKIGIIPIPSTLLAKRLHAEFNWPEDYPITDEEAVSYISKNLEGEE